MRCFSFTKRPSRRTNSTFISNLNKKILTKNLKDKNWNRSNTAKHIQESIIFMLILWREMKTNGSKNHELIKQNQNGYYCEQRK